jgi:hypothetical protein
VIVAMTNLRFRQNSEKRRRLQAPANAVRWRAGCILGSTPALASKP